MTVQHSIISESHTKRCSASVAFVIAYTRLPLFLFEALAESLLYFWQGLTGRCSLSWSPVMHHELIYFPLPFLADHIVVTAETDFHLARCALDSCAVAPGQRLIQRSALWSLQARELADCALSRSFNTVTILRGVWLPGIEGADHLLLMFSDLARYFQAAQSATFAYHRVRHLERAEQTLCALKNRLTAARSHLARELLQIIPVWWRTLEALKLAAEIDLHRELPNPFRAGQALDPEHGREVFRGREGSVRKVERLLADIDNPSALALLGPRRCGKTSLLKMLPTLLPEVVVVFFDLQDNPANTPEAFFNALDAQARLQALRNRNFELPALDEYRRFPVGHKSFKIWLEGKDGAPLETAKRWFDALESSAGDRSILFCIDEFERLEDLFPGERRQLLQFMGLLRATIQHKRRVRLLVSGAAPFEEWDKLWSDHFINVREVPIGHLSRRVTTELLTRPTPEFPPEAIPLSLAEAVYERTGGQPYLVQLYGSLLVSRLNETKRHRADFGDLEAVEVCVLEEGTYYFRNLYRSAPEAARLALNALAQKASPAVDVPTRRWLERRLLLDGTGHLNIPVLGRWIVEEEL